jgi:rRNA processing protein Gar1
MSRATTIIGKCSIKVQGKILVQLEGHNLPKIGSRALIKRNDQFKVIGAVTEAIGSTRNPWIVILPKKDEFETIQLDEVLYSGDHSKKKRKKKGSKGRMFSKQRD